MLVFVVSGQSGQLPLLILTVSALVYVLSLFIPVKDALSKIPGPRLYALTRFRLALDAWHARSIHTIYKLHLQYGPVVRIGPREVSLNNLAALKIIYGAGSSFERTLFYRMFDAYGRPNLFTFSSTKDHRERKKLLSHIYANQTILGPAVTNPVKAKVFAYLTLLRDEPVTASEIFSSLHYFSLDVTSYFVYGASFGATAALTGSQADRALLDDILNPSRRRLAWFGAHFPTYTKWVTSRSGVLEYAITRLGLMPMPKPFVYSGIRRHALEAFHSFKVAQTKLPKQCAETTVISKLMACQKEQGLSDMDIASECADHLLAGIDTTADSLMFLFWALALPRNRECQEKLRAEILQVSVDERGIPLPKDLARLPYLNAVLRESLRLYSPLPAFEPRVSTEDTVIEGYQIPAGTVVGMSPYCLHRESSVFEHPHTFQPERWLTGDGHLVPESDPRNKHFWAFSSGARMCIGIHLANAEMLTLVAAVLVQYRILARHPDISPGITSRYEVFQDEMMPKVAEHECHIDFEPIDQRYQIPT